MSISSVSATTTPVYQAPPQNGIRQNFQQLAQALQSGDLSNAQAAYASLIQNLPHQNPNGSSTSNNPFQQAIASIGSALQSGDLKGAQQALQTLQSQMKGAHHGHHHRHGTTQTGTSDTSGSTINSGVAATSPVGLYV